MKNGNHRTTNIKRAHMPTAKHQEENQDLQIVNIKGRKFVKMTDPPVPARPVNPRFNHGDGEKPATIVPVPKPIPQVSPILFGESDEAGAMRGVLFPHRKVATLGYADVFSMLSSGLTVYTYRLNSLYDPDETGVGNQPVGFDQLMALYKYYRVIRAKVTCLFANTGTTAYIVAVPSGNATDPGGFQSASCWPQAKYCVIGAAGGESTQKLELDIDIRKFFGYHSDNWDMDLTGTTSSNPTQMLYLHIMAQEFDASAKALDGTVNIEFHAEFTNLTQLPVS